MASKKEVEVKPTTADIEQMSPAIRAMVDTISSTLDVEDAFQASLSILDRILQAETPEDVFKGIGALVHARDTLVNIPIEVSDIRWNVSTFEGETNVGFYCIFDFVNLLTNEKNTGSVGSLNCMAQLYALEKLGAMPYSLVLCRTDKPTKSGFYPLFFRPVSEEERERISIANGEPVEGEEPF